MTCVEQGPWTVCFGPPMEVISRNELGERWCFICRARRPFALVVSAPTVPSYSGPSASVECDQGHDDGDYFPGRSREWVELP